MRRRAALDKEGAEAVLGGEAREGGGQEGGGVEQEGPRSERVVVSYDA